MADVRRRLVVVIDREACVGSGMCVATAAGTFALDRGGQAVVLDPSGDPVSAVLEAAEGCPVTAIQVRDADTGEVLFPYPG
jgi:ferredoxin